MVRLTLAPLQSKKPVGAVAVGHIRISPEGDVLAAAVIAKAVVAICVVDVPAEAVGAAGVPVNVGLDLSALEEIAPLMATSSSSISVPLTILEGLPVDSASLAAKSVVLV
jgi:hypothetical protein